MKEGMEFNRNSNNKDYWGVRLSCLNASCQQVAYLCCIIDPSTKNIMAKVRDTQLWSLKYFHKLEELLIKYPIPDFIVVDYSIGNHSLRLAEWAISHGIRLQFTRESSSTKSRSHYAGQEN